MAKMGSYVFFSNRVEELAGRLQRELFEIAAPFQRRIVIVPDTKVKSYLYEYFALKTDAKVAFGMEVMTLSEALQELIRKHKKSAPFYLPSTLDISLCLEDQITALHLNPRQEPIFASLQRYLGKPSLEVSSSLRRKIISLSEQLARFFSLLGLQPAHVIEDWEKKQGWQQHLWGRIFREDSIWSYPQKVFGKAVPCVDKVHVFGFSYIPEVYQTFFQRTCCFNYVLSPSEYFWEDLYSDRERVYLQKVLEGKKVRLKVREQFDLYLRESNPLLGNWGTMGKEFIARLGQAEPYIEESYIPSDTKTLLSKIQNDFLHLGGDEYDDARSRSDNTIQVHACTSKLREVEALYETLLLLMKNHRELLPSDIIVLSPALERYIPYIHQVFSSGCIEYRLMDTEEISKEDFLPAFELLLSLSEKRFERSVVLELFSYVPFQKRQGWKAEDVYLLAKWTDQVGIHWGVDPENRKEILEKSLMGAVTTTSTGTWQHGFERIVAGLVFAVTEETKAEALSLPWPYYGVEWSESELLGQVVMLLSEMAQDLKKLDSLQASLAEWITLFQQMAQKYFAIEDSLFASECNKLKTLHEESFSPLSLASFRRVFHFMARKRRSSFQGSILEAITFSSLRVGSVVPAKVVCLLGLEEEAFPRSEPALSLCDLSSLKSESYIPTRAEEDRYLFLEALLAAREYFIISYCRVSSQDHKPQNAAAVVEDLIRYIVDKQYLDKEGIVTAHPALSFHESYFSKKNAASAVSATTQGLAQSYYNKKRTTLSPFLPEFYGQIQPSVALSASETVSIKELFRFAKHPIKFFLQDILDVYLPSLFQKEEAEFLLPGYERSDLRRKLLKHSAYEVLKVSMLKGILPVGLFEDVAKKKVVEESRIIEGSLIDWGIRKEEIFSIYLSESCKKFGLCSEKLTLPAIQIRGSLGTVYTLEGILSDVTPKGLLYFGENKVRDLICIWPLYLVFLLLAKKALLEGSNLYLMKKKEILTFDVRDPEELLGSYLDYFSLCKKQASLLMPSWAEWILDNNEKEFEKKMREKAFIETSPFPDEYLRWIFLRDPSPSLEGLSVEKKRLQNKIFDPLFSRSKVL